MRASDIERLLSVSAPTADPDGSRVVVAVAHPDLDADRTVGQLWSVPIDGSGAHRITRGISDRDPAFSPDGGSLAFLRSIPGGKDQIFVIGGGGADRQQVDPVQITDASLGVVEFRWSEDSRQIAFIAAVPEPGRYGTVDGLAADAEPPRRLTGVTYKRNGVGYTNDRRAHVFLVEVPALDAEPSYSEAPRVDGAVTEASGIPSATQLTRGDFADSRPRFIGDRVAFLSARHPTRDTDLVNQLWVVESDGASEPVPLTSPGPWAIETTEPDGQGGWYLIAQDLGPSGVDFVGRTSALLRLPASTTDPEPLTTADGPDLTGSGVTVTPDGVLVRSVDQGRIPLVRVSTDGDVVLLTSGEVEVSGVAVVGSDILVSYSTPGSAGEVGVVGDGGVRPLTDFGAGIGTRSLVVPSELRVTARDGYPVHGWVARPAGEGPHPTLLMIHGGPFAQYSIHLLDETQVYVDAGYAVVYCNPRGSAGYGQEHGRVIQHAMGSVDLTDVLDFLDGALASDPELDATRLGILGGSYGGYLTAWTIAHDHRFAAAIVERGYLDPLAFVGSSDIGATFPQQYNGVDREAILRQSPQAVAHRVTTPTLVIHSEDDLRCPIGQAETYYATLKLAGVDAEMLVFPGENHELSRSGRPRHRVQRFDAILDWFARYV